MPDTLLNVELEEGEWVDLYAITGIAVGTRINSQNIGATVVRHYSAATAPVGEYGYTPTKPWESATNDDGDAGALAISTVGNGLIQVKRVI